ncbi:hypothetical protein [Streptococcus sp. Marseille-P7376]|uniref:hypothetical protein n=1 Tax=Streptococcus sp. Marseille-P7376 TaxID=2592044 RepID=UPI0011E6A753|nr:hypothetical protein [Streptococcus sp. Marseille-P7376]
MEILSKEIQLQGLQLLKQTLETLVELEKQRSNKLDLISRKELMDLLGISATTLDNWESLGLQRYQTPTDGAKKIFYRPSDVYLFLAIK